MKYIVMMFGDQASMRERRSEEWIAEMMAFMHKVNEDLVAAGELVAAEGLVDAPQAKTVRHGRDGVFVTDGPFAESKESLAGYWIIEVPSEARAIEFASHVVAFTQGPIEVRAIGHAPEV